MKIYEITSAGHGKYAFAAGYYPFNDMAFMDEMDELKRKMMLDFWRINPCEPGIEIEESASCWPDVMSCTFSPPSCFFSRKVLESLEAHGIAAKRATFIPVGKLAKGKIKTVPPPDYFIIEALPGIQIDYAASGYTVDADGYPDTKIRRPTPRPVLQHDPETWSGLDLFCSSNYFGRPRYLQLLCTERVREIAAEDGWENVHFQRVRVKGVNPITGRPE
jgi:hypothetical protein